MSSRNFKRLVSMEISRLNPLNNSSNLIINTTAAWPNESSANNTNLSPVMNVNNCLLNSDNNSTITNNICDTIIPLSNHVMNQSTNNMNVEKEIYFQQDDLQLNLFSDSLLLSTMDTEIVKPPTFHLNQKFCKLFKL